MITVHHLNNSHSHVVLWLLEELGLEYQIVHHQRDAKTYLSPDSLRAVHPLAKAPTIEDRGITMVESTGILLYLLETYGAGRLRPAPNTRAAMQFFQWITYIEGSAKAPLMLSWRLRRLAVTLDDTQQAQVKEQVDKPLRFINDRLQGEDYLVNGVFSAADIQLAFFEVLAEGSGALDAYPNMTAHLARMRDRIAYQQAEAKGGPVGFTKLFGRAADK